MPKHKIPSGQKIVSSTIVDNQEIIKLKPYERPYVVDGKTYKISPPIFKHALYVTINNIVLPDSSIRPIEIFANSKNMDSFQWIVGLTRLASALLRQPLDFIFIIDELKDVFDPHGSYFIPGSKGKKANSVVAHIGAVLQEHCEHYGLLEQPELSDESKQFIADKLGDDVDIKKLEKEKTVCPDCGEKEVIKLDGCPVCMVCGYSKCG